MLYMFDWFENWFKIYFVFLNVDNINGMGIKRNFWLNDIDIYIFIWIESVGIL